MDELFILMPVCPTCNDGIDERRAHIIATANRTPHALLAAGERGAGARSDSGCGPTSPGGGQGAGKGTGAAGAN